ncbi:MAG: hypothetical protein ABSF09_00515 [Candidatus Bathyarchaeia archaeon]
MERLEGDLGLTLKTDPLGVFVSKLREYSEMFNSGRMGRMAVWLSATADRVSRKDFKDIWADYTQAYGAVRGEFSNGNSELEALFDEVKGRMPVIPSGALLSVSKMEDGLRQTMNPQQVFMQILNVFNSGSLTVEQRFYGMCFQYVILVEGIYDETLRYLLMWWDNTQGKTPSVQDMTIRKVKTELESRGAQSVLFKGWEPRIRNSIAHARFSYDEKRDKAIFDDVNRDDPTNTFHKEMTYNEFGEMGMSLYNVVFLTETVLVMGHLVPMMLSAAERLPK